MLHKELFTCYDIYYSRSGLFFSLAKERLLVVYPFELGVIVLWFLVYCENKGQLMYHGNLPWRV